MTTMNQGDFSLCGRCAAQGKTCCQKSRVYLTSGDAARIAAHTGSTDFFEYVVPVTVTFDPDIDPEFAAVLQTGRQVRLLRHAVEDDCVFLGADGCRLPLAVRPLICRLYPFDYNNRTIKSVDAHLCPEPEKDCAPLMLALLGMNRDEAEGWRHMLYAELSESPKRVGDVRMAP